MVHFIDLKGMRRIVEATQGEAAMIDDQRITTHYLQEATEGLVRLTGLPHRNRRAINWLGSAWKWIAGSPDAADWDE